MQEKKRFRLRMTLYALVVLVLYLLQSARGTQLQVFGVTPDLLPFALCAVALFEGPYVGAAFGLGAGLLTSINSTAAEGLMALYYSLGCLGLGFFSTKYMRRVYPTLLLGGLILSGLKSLLVFFFYYALVYEAGSFGALTYSGMRIALSALFSPLIYLLFRKIHLGLSQAE